ncbi:MAG: hypothetical protein AAFX45_10195 [Pseudomonadota bacterium]
MTRRPTGRQDDKRRFFLETLETWADDNGFAVSKLSGDWVVLLTRGGLVLPVISYDIGLNPSSVHRIVNDKVATFDVLRAAGVAALEHQIVLDADLARSRGQADELARVTAVFDAMGDDAVLKPLDQSQGLDVMRVRTPGELAEAYARLSVRYPRFCISPFVRIAREDRFYFLDDACLLSYGKRATVGGLGNLAQGAEVIFHDGSESPARVLAARARAAIALRYGCIDVATLADGSRWVLEANSGVMLDEIARAAATAGVDLPLAATYRAGLDALVSEREG